MKQTTKYLLSYFADWTIVGIFAMTGIATWHPDNPATEFLDWLIFVFAIALATSTAGRANGRGGVPMATIPVWLFTAGAGIWIQAKWEAPIAVPTTVIALGFIVALAISGRGYRTATTQEHHDKKAKRPFLDN